MAYGNDLGVPAICVALILVICSAVQMFAMVSSVGDLGLKIENLEVAKFQLQQEWKHSVFVKNVFVVDASKDCAAEKEGGQTLFTYDWPGLRSYYDNEGRTTFESTHREGRVIVPHEIKEPGFPMMQNSVFDGKKICGETLDFSYTETKPINSDGSCESGFTSCSGGGSISLKNQICYPSDKVPDATHCPITSMHFAKVNRPGDFAYVDFNGEFKIGFSKTVDALPLSQYQVQLKEPCISSQTGPWGTFQFETMHYYNENQVVENLFTTVDLANWTMNCRRMEPQGAAVSERYTNILEDDPQISVKLFEQENKVKEILQTHTPDYPKVTVEDQKQINFLKFWAAPVLQFGSDCEDASPADTLTQIDGILTSYAKAPYTWGTYGAGIGRLAVHLLTAFYGVIMLLDHAKPFIRATAVVIPALWLFFTIKLNGPMSRVSSLSPNEEFQKFGTQCLTPLQVFTQPFDLSQNTSQINKVNYIEYLIWAINLGAYGVLSYAGYMNCKNYEYEGGEGGEKESLLSKKNTAIVSL